jgi:opacity protein-like surface antigen
MAPKLNHPSAMSITRARLGFILAAVALAMPARAARSQEIGPFIGGGVGGIPDVRRPLGVGLTGLFLFHDWIGVRGDAGYYWTLEHRNGCFAVRDAAEAGSHCVSAKLASDSHFPLLDAVAVLRAHIPGKGVRYEVGAGPSWVNVTNHIRATDNPQVSEVTSSARAGYVAMVGILARPQWRIPVTVEGQYAYHNTAKFGGTCSGLNDPLCDQQLSFHELRLALLYRLNPKP